MRGCLADHVACIFLSPPVAPLSWDAPRLPPHRPGPHRPSRADLKPERPWRAVRTQEFSSWGAGCSRDYTGVCHRPATWAERPYLLLLKVAEGLLLLLLQSHQHSTAPRAAQTPVGRWVAGWSASRPQAEGRKPWPARWAWGAPSCSRAPGGGSRGGGVALVIATLSLFPPLRTPLGPERQRAAPPTLALQPSLRVLWGGGGGGVCREHHSLP